MTTRGDELQERSPIGQGIREILEASGVRGPMPTAEAPSPSLPPLTSTESPPETTEPTNSSPPRARNHQRALDLLNNAAVRLYELGLDAEATALFVKILRLDPEHSLVKENLALLQEEQG